MANKYLDTSFLDKAMIFAIKAHAGTERRAKGFPYVIHPFEAVEIVSTMTKDQELLAAAALHDTVEDTSVSLEDIRREFGERVAKLVEEESDKFMEGVSESDSWHERKQAAISRLAAASYEAKMVALGDKLSNMRAIARDYDSMGDELWKIFHVTEKSEHEWHYRGLAESLSELEGTPAYKEFASLVNHVFSPEFQMIDLQDYIPGGEGFTAMSYNSKQGDSIAKLYAGFISRDAIVQEFRNARAALRLGIVTPRPIRLVTDGKRFGSEYERIPEKKSFARIIADEPDRLEEIALRFSKEAKAFHSVENDEALDVKDKYLELILRADFLSETTKQAMTDFLNSLPKKSNCLHGDMHIGNIITDGKQTLWIDLPDFGKGDPMFDIALLFIMAKYNPDDLTRRLYHISNEQFVRVWDIFVREYFSPEQDQDAIEKTLGKYAAVILAGFQLRYPLQEEVFNRIFDSFPR